MLKRQNLKKENKVKVTFVVPAEMDGCSVLGDFNNWDPEAMPFKKRSNGTCSVAVKLDPGQKYIFRYRKEDGTWFNEEDADDFETNEHGSQNCVLLT